MTTRLNIENLSKLVKCHAHQIEQGKRGVPHDKLLVDAVVRVLHAVEMRAGGMPEIAAAVHSVRKALRVRSE